MRVAIVAPPWMPVPPPAYGGIESVLDALCRALTHLGHDVLLATTGDSTCPVPRTWVHERAVGVGVGGPMVELAHVRHAYEQVVGCDVVHDHTLTGPVWSRGRRHLPPVVTTNHGAFDRFLGPLYRDLAHDVPILALSHDHAATAVGTPIRAVIHHGIVVEDVPTGDGGGGHLAFLGRMCPDKGVVEAIRTARRAGLPLLVAAKMHEPAEQQYYEDVVRPLLGGDVEYVGELGGADKFALLGSARCLLNPIQWAEPFGMVMIEALACGTPVVATPRGSAAELIDHGVTGFLAARPDDLVAAVRAVEHLDRAACRRAAEARFSAARMAADHVEVYESLRRQETEGRSAMVA